MTSSTGSNKPQQFTSQPPLVSPYFRKKLSSGISRIRSATKTSLALIGLATVAPFVYEFYTLEGKSEKKKKGVLLLPFHRMKIVEKKKISPLQTLTSFLSSDSEKPFEVEVRELVDLIHSAASDPSVVALYGTFGNTGNFAVGGLAHVEEIRNAIRVFNQSHRVHSEPNIHHNKGNSLPKEKSPKKTFAFADSFEGFDDNKEYFLASEFQTIFMQKSGSLKLYGMSFEALFLRDAFDKYGIKVDVFKHGKYKNAANTFTDRKYNSPHRENTEALLSSLESAIRSGINDSRLLHHSLDEQMWNAIRDYGSLTSLNAEELGLINAYPPIDPLYDFLDAKDADKPDRLENFLHKWGESLDPKSFEADHAITMEEYSNTLAQKRNKAKRNLAWDRMRHKFLELVTKTETMGIGSFLVENCNIRPPYFMDKVGYLTEVARLEGEEIAIVHVDGIIGKQTAADVVNTLRKIKVDPKVKSVILRVNSPGGSSVASETILMECQDLPQPVICSMGNYAASGGYFVAANCNRIFALPTTVTGSIGVIGLKLDVTKWAARHGIKVDYVVSGSHSGMASPFRSMNKSMKETFQREVDFFYEWFKTIVATGRGYSADKVESIAQGRVYTGAQAKDIGLVDELGGLSRAIAYAQENFTISGNAEVEVWPKDNKLGFLNGLSMINGSSLNSIFHFFFSPLEKEGAKLEKAHHPNTLQLLLDVSHGPGSLNSGISPLMALASQPGAISDISLTTNEMDAFELMLEDSNWR
eukprot:CAMPEP_0195508558 /NCGR_PEP_ID=MMETSP0794_2-20130614/1735_1 /TAXON_ID=515487 /ORGANISM="Stephanopyxis turris, Strain CCMP 815" /LENGTH=754 /DNA_ID=CAMNT_0040635551 /DNA_START=85 /DNA_END=2349 /DNA_ORIENTATION=+